MRKSMAATAVAFVLGITAASAQGLPDKVGSSNTSAGRLGVASQAQREHARRDNATGANTHSAFSRNVGPGSSVSGSAESEMGSAASGNTRDPHAPAAGGLGGGGQ